MLSRAPVPQPGERIPAGGVDIDAVKAAATDIGRSVDALEEQLRTIVSARQELHAGAAGRERLEANRRELVRLQRLLSEALIARLRPSPA